MSKNWIPMQKTMARYCEPYFHALSRWKDYKDRALIENRLQAVCTLSEILKSWVLKPEVYEFSLMSELDSDLLPEVLPEAGVDFTEGNDRVAFASAKKLIHEKLFQSGGWYFQNNLLKALAGWNDETLSLSNAETRASAIESVERLFRVSESAGNVYILYYARPSTDSIVMDLCPLTVDMEKLLSHIVAFRAQLTAISASHNTSSSSKVSETAPTTRAKSTGVKRAKSISDDEIPGTMKPKSKEISRKKSKSSNHRIDREEEASLDESNDVIKWTTNHESIGLKVAKYFPIDNSKILYKGEVTKYAPPSKPEVGDELYHIVYEDGDEEDYTALDLTRFRKLFLKQSIDWTDRHFRIGTKVGKYETVEIFDENKTEDTVAIGADDSVEAPVAKEKKRRRSTTKKSVFVTGTVIQYAIGRTGPDQIYLVSWDDGEDQEMTDKQFNDAVETLKTAEISNSSEPIPTDIENDPVV